MIVTSIYSQFLHLRRSNYEQKEKSDKKTPDQAEVFKKVKKKKITIKISGSSTTRQPIEFLTAF